VTVASTSPTPTINRVEKIRLDRRLRQPVSASLRLGQRQFEAPVGWQSTIPPATVYVADSDNAGVQKFDSTGAYLSQFRYLRATETFSSSFRMR